MPSTAPDPTLLSTFRQAAREAGMDPDNRWVGGYVDYEERHLAPLLGAYGLDPAGQRIVELGCHIGASAVVMARMGGTVTGVDIDPAAVSVARANLALHGVADRASALHVPDTRSLPFDDVSFDVALANSVLECAEAHMVPAIVAELARVVRPGGRLLICGTASRLAPYAVHDGRWGVNYLPRAADRWLRRRPFRGLSPRLLHRAVAGLFEVEAKDRWLPARRAVHGRTSLPVRGLAAAARWTGVAPGWVSPTIELLLRRV